MAFSSVQFLFVFLPLSLAVYWLCPKWLRNAVLAAFSLLFFAWAGLKGAAILVLLAGINWLGGLSLGRLAHKRPLLILLILLDLAFTPPPPPTISSLALSPEVQRADACS